MWPVLVCVWVLPQMVLVLLGVSIEYRYERRRTDG